MTVCRVTFPLNNDIKVFWIKDLPSDIDEELVIKWCREICPLDLGPGDIEWFEEVPYGVIPTRWQ